MTGPGLRAALKELLSALAQALPGQPPTTLVTVGGVMCLIVVVVLVRRLTRGSLIDAVTSLIDAVTRRRHVDGRARANNTLTTAIAQHGSPADMQQALETVNRPSPLDAPDANLYVGPQDTAAIPCQRTGPGRHRVIDHRGSRLL